MLLYVHFVSEDTPVIVVTIFVQQADDFTLVKVYKTSKYINNFTAFAMFDEVLVNASANVFDEYGFEAHYRATLNKFDSLETVIWFLLDKGFEVTEVPQSESMLGEQQSV